MKAPKYAVSTDHKSGYNNLDKNISLNATTILEAISETFSIIENDDNLWCTTIYEVVKGSKGTKYKPVLRNFGHGGFYTAEAGSWNDNHVRIRSVYGNVEVYEIHYDWEY